LRGSQFNTNPREKVSETPFQQKKLYMVVCAFIPSYMGSVSRRTVVQASQGKNIHVLFSTPSLTNGLSASAFEDGRPKICVQICSWQGMVLRVLSPSGPCQRSYARLQAGGLGSTSINVWPMCPHSHKWNKNDGLTSWSNRKKKSDSRVRRLGLLYKLF
jgi:hypothetical protein